MVRKYLYLIANVLLISTKYYCSNFFSIMTYMYMYYSDHSTCVYIDVQLHVFYDLCTDDDCIYVGDIPSCDEP